MRSIIEKLHKTMYLPLIIVLLLIFALCVNTPKEIITGYYKIMISPGILVTDYLAISNLGATLFNVATIMSLNMFFIHWFKLRFSGAVYSGLMIIAGFSFFGKNIFNAIPIYFGIYLYGLIKKIPFKNLVIYVLFSSGISPLVSYCFFGFELPFYYSIPLGITCGIIAGLVIPAIASHTILFHNGYNLFNTGFALGVISLFFYATFTSFNLEVKGIFLVNNEYHYYLLGCLVFIFVFCVTVALIYDHTCLKRYKQMLKRSGRLVSDFIKDFGVDTVLLNVGLMALVCLIVVLVFNVQVNGPVIGTIISVLGLGAYGAHLKNMLPILIGAILATLLMGLSISEDGVILAIIFSVALAPVAGKYGILLGVLAGALHVIITPLMIYFHGGFDLYNNGFSSGFVACVIVVCADSFGKEDD